MDPIHEFGSGLPESLKVALNAIAFLAAATSVWYAYFVKGKKAAVTASEEVEVASKHLVISPVDGQVLHTLSHNIERVADALEEISSTMHRSATEAEIERRVREQLTHVNGGGNGVHMKDIT
jgi:hypothetical protein